VGWREGWSLDVMSFTAFCIFLSYNIARLILLWKTQQLDTTQQVTGFPAKFSLSEPHNIGLWSPLRLFAFIVDAVNATVLSFRKSANSKEWHKVFAEMLVARWPLYRSPVNGWFVCYKLSRLIAGLALASVVFNSYHFLSQKIPTNTVPEEVGADIKDAAQKIIKQIQ
jgi:hypothetical protein